MSSDTPSGKIITFYSYKGGTGRSMALANVAWILASNGKRVLVVDWDLEAPGLHRYFRPFLPDPYLVSSEGIIDMVLDFSLEAITPVEEGKERPPDWYLPFADILRYATSMNWSFPAQGRLDFIPAGKQTIAYAARMNSFDWRNFYERLGGGAFLEAVVSEMKKEYDYILIDSRTGVSDTSGICTVKMPDALVVCFTLNNQGIEGAASVAESVATQRGSSSLPIYPVATRIEHAEKNKLEARKKYAKELFGKYPQHLTSSEREKYFEEVKIPYVPFYAYEEVLACFGDTPGAIDTVLAVMERLVSYLTDGAVREWVSPTEEERETVKEQYAGRSATQEEEVTVRASDEAAQTIKRTIPDAPSTYKPPASVVETIFLAYSHKDQALADQLRNHLAVLRRMGLIADWYEQIIPPGETWSDEISSQLDSAKLILLLVSADFIASDYCYGSEMKRALERQSSGEARVIPIILRSVAWEGAPFGKFQALPTNGRPITSWDDMDAAFLDVTQGIRKVIEQLTTGETMARTVSETASLYIPRPPLSGYIARHDTEGNDLLTRLKKELSPQSNQFIALWGRGGVGKTTIAAEAARSLLDAYDQRIIWINADTHGTISFYSLLDEMATQLGRSDLRQLKQEHKEEQVRLLISAAPTLIVIDKFEVIPPEEQSKCAVFLSQSVICSTLITTRQRVNFARNIVINSMPMDEARSFLATLIEQTADPHVFAKVDRDRLIQMAEGIPFVIQWVVAQIDLAQEPETVLKELEQGTSDAIQRVFDRSFNLPQVGADGRATLLALSLFLPSASRQALAAVAGFKDDFKRLNAAIKSLRALWLIGVTEGNERLTLAGLTRSLVRARLSEDERRIEFNQRFISYFHAFTESHSQSTPEDYDALEEEKDNALCAIQIAFQSMLWNEVVAIYAALTDFLDVRGYWDEAIDYGEQALQAAHHAKSYDRIALFSHNVATIYERRGNLAKAEHLYYESLETAKKIDDKLGIAITLNQLGTIAYSQGELAEARRLYNESLEIHKKLNYQMGIAATLHGLATTAYVQGELEEARSLYNESLRIAKELDDQVGVANNLYRVGTISLEEGDLRQAERLYQESLAIHEKLGNQSGIATSFYALGISAHYQGNLEEAGQLYTKSLEISSRLGNQDGTAKALHQLGQLAEEQGNKAKAIETYRLALSIFEQLGSPNAETTRELLSRLENESKRPVEVRDQSTRASGQRARAEGNPAMTKSVQSAKETLS